MSKRTVLMIAVILVASLAGCSFRTPTPGSAWPGGKTVIPWLEVNVPDKPLEEWAYRPRGKAGADSSSKDTVLDYCVDGLLIWATVTRQVIVTTKIGKVSKVYKKLMEKKPEGLSIIGGLKTYNLAGAAPGDSRTYDFADPAGWRKIAEESQKIVDLTGVNIVVLECETAWQPFLRGEKKDDDFFDRLRRSLAPLAKTGIQFWWNPVRIKRGSGSFLGREDQTTELVHTIAEALSDCVFLTSYTAWHGWGDDDSDEPRLRQLMIDLVGEKRIQERLIVTVDGHVGKRTSYTPAEALEMIAELPGQIINVYPTGPHWVKVAEELQTLLNASTATSP